MRKLAEVYLKPYGKRMIWELAIKFASTLGELALPMILSYVIDTVIPQRNVDRILLWGLLMAGCGAFSCATHIVTNRMSADIAGRAAERMRNDLFEKICDLPEESAEAFTAPSLVSRVTGDSYILYDTMVYLQRTGVRAPIILVCSSIFMLLMDPVLAALVFFAAAFTIRAVRRTAARCVSLYQKVQEKNDGVWGKVMEAIAGLRVIKAFSREKEESGHFRQVNEEAAKQEQKAGMAMAAVAPILNVCLQLCMIFLLLAGSLRVYTGKLLPGKMIAFLTYVSLILTALLNVSKVLMLFSKASACGQRITEVLWGSDAMAELPGEDIPDRDESMIKTPSPCFLEFDHVGFAYPLYQTAKKRQEGGKAVEDISFRLKKGEWLGIVGGTGAGKTTVLQLMMGYRQPDQGSIRMMGVPVSDMEPDQVRGMFAPVFQYDYICGGTLADNIRFGREIDADRMREAAAHAQAMEYITGRPGGFLAQAEAGGKNLSGGQKQRLLIARALAGDESVLVFDDSFSALDYQTARMLWDVLREKYRGRTAVIVSQRMGLMPDMDQVLVLEAGRAVGCGSHERLLCTCPVYQELWHMGMEGGCG